MMTTSTYERLVVRRKKRKRAKPEEDEAAAVWEETPEEDGEVVKEEVARAVRLSEARKKEQVEYDARVVETVKRLRLARNVRGLARWSHCSPHWLAFQLVAGTALDEIVSFQRYRRSQRLHKRREEEVTSGVERSLRLERVSARLYLDRAVDFRPDTVTTVEGKHRVIDELLFFSPPDATCVSHIGYAERGNVVPPPPLRGVKSCNSSAASRMMHVLMP
uniref:Uncharacterized protein n=1 Tax=Hyaloperonospora arabidopsidis (strain Emoy2) TaxID=559515 RepID=M4BIC3_HYAAE